MPDTVLTPTLALDDQEHLDHVAGVTRARLRLVATMPAEMPVEFRHGDVIVGNRLSAVQRLNTLSGECVTHSGIVVEFESQLHAVEFGARGCFTRPLTDFEAAYRWVGLGRLDMSDACRERVVQAALGHLADADLRYSWWNIGLIGVLSLSRRLSPAAIESVSSAVIVGAARRGAGRLGSDAVTCSSFVARCLSAACPACRPRFQWPTRPRDLPWRGCSTATDVRPLRTGRRLHGAVAVAMTTPTDLWATPCFEFRAIRRPDGDGGIETVVLAENGRPSCRAACVADEGVLEGR